MFLSPDKIGSLQSKLLEDCWAFSPELILCAAIILMLLERLLPFTDRWHLGTEAMIMTIVALVVTGVQISSDRGVYDAFGGSPLVDGRPVHVGLLRYDGFTLFIRLFLFSTTALIIWLSRLTRIPDQEDSGDFYTLLLGATVGMSLMASANHLLMVFIAVEMASLPSFALAGFLKGRRQSSEAALKYVVYGGGASGIMLYGISLIVGRFGTGYLPDLAQVIPVATTEHIDAVMLLGLLFIFIGLAFKLSAVPFHFWCPDVFEGASAEVAGFLSVASKGAAMALVARLALSLTGPGIAVGALADYLIPTLAFFAALTATFGNLAAYPQTNLKRLLAYSTIAHAGYMMMGLATLTAEGIGAVLFYLIAYLFMNLGAFAVVAFLRNATGSEDLSSFRGLVYRSPLLVVTLGTFLLSLLGIPPLIGFAAKFQIFRVLFDAAQQQQVASNATSSWTLYALLVIGGVNTVISLFYYINVLKVMVLDRPLEEVERVPAAELPLPPGSAFYAAVMAGLILVGGILWNPLKEFSDVGVADFRVMPAATVRTAAADATQPRGVAQP